MTAVDTIAPPDVADDGTTPDGVTTDVAADVAADMPLDVPADVPTDTGAPDTATFDPCSPELNPSCAATICELADGTPGRCSWLSNGLCGCTEDCGDATQSWHVAIEQNPMLTNCGTTTNIPVAAATNCTDAIDAAWDLLLLIADCLNPCCPPGSTISQGTSACTVDPYTYASGAPAIRYQVDWTYTCDLVPPPEPNPCATCETDADCFGGYVCADALNTWDDPATPNICTQPCWGNGVCPAGMFCDFSISKYCQCDQPDVDLSLTKTVSNATPNPGDTILYSVTITNSSAATATGVQVTDVLPAGVTFASFGGASFGTFDVTTGVWTIATIPPFTYGNLVLYVTIDAAANGAIVNTAEVTAAGQPDPDSTPANGVAGEDDLASVTITVTQPVVDLSLTKTVSNATPHPGDTIMYSVTISNSSAFPATGVQITDVLPAGVTFASFGGASFGTYDMTTGVWTIPTIPPFTYGNLVLYVTVDASANGAIVNTAEITAAGQLDPDSTPGNHVVGEDDLASVTITVTQPDPCHDLRVVSDLTNTVDGTAATAVEVTPTLAGWNPATLAIPGAMWIWTTNPASNPATETHVFRKTFAWTNPVGAAVLTIASDNGYSVTLNGVSVDDSGAPLVDPTPTGTTFQAPVTYSVANAIVSGTNTLDVSVTNNNAAHSFNPAGLRYALEVFCQAPSPCAPCHDDADCAGGLACFDDDGFPQTPKVCTGPCGAFPTASGCADGQTCDPATGACRCDRCNDAWNPQCVPTDCVTADGTLGACHPTAIGCLCNPPNFCQTCTTDADCSGGLVCADAENSWDDPATPNICTEPCGAEGTCPDGLTCDFTVSKYCRCDECTPPPPQMAAWWPLDEAAGVTAAELVSNLDGTWVAGPTPVTGMVAGALEMSGGYVQVPNSPLLDAGNGNFSVDAWIKYDADPPLAICQDTILEHGAIQFGILWWADEFEVRFPPSFHEHVPFTGGPNQWHFVALTLDRADPMGVRVYMDGALMGAYPSAGIGSLSTGSDLFLGINATLSCPFFGDLDEVEYFKRALAPHEISDIYEAGSAGKCKDDACTPDVTPPVLSCPGPVSVLAAWPACKAKPLPAYALDNCDPVPVVTASPSGFAGAGVYLVTYTAADASGNTSTCQSEVHVFCDPCSDPSNPTCEPKECKLADGTPGKCDLNAAAGCGCRPVVVPPDPCGHELNPTCEPAKCELADGATGKCVIDVLGGCFCYPVPAPKNPCVKCDSDATCTGGLTCQDDDNNQLTPKVCTTTYDPAGPACPTGTHGDYNVSKYCICEDCGGALNPTCTSVECTTQKGDVGKCKLNAAGCECVF